MGRIQIPGGFPWTFGNVQGNVPASRLDQNFLAVPDQGVLTVRAQELSDGSDYNVEIDDEYSFFVCKGTADFQVIPPVAPDPGFSFFVSNETRAEAVEIEVTLCCTIFVGTVSYLNPTLIGDFPPLYHNVKGGLVQFDGNNYFLYPLFFGSSGGGGIQQGTVSVNAGDLGVTVTHGFNEPGLTVVLLPQWNTTVYQISQTNTQVEFGFSTEVPDLSPSLVLTYLIIFP